MSSRVSKAQRLTDRERAGEVWHEFVSQQNLSNVKLVEYYPARAPATWSADVIKGFQSSTTYRSEASWKSLARVCLTAEPFQREARRVLPRQSTCYLERRCHQGFPKLNDL